MSSREYEHSLYVLWNRVNAQMGLAAFRQGHFYEAHIALLDLNSFQKAKELLSQGVTFQRGSDRDKEKEELQERSIIPYHMQIPLDLLECVALICGLLLEVPNMAFLAYDKNGRKRYQTIYSKPLRTALEKAERSTVLTPAESMRERIVESARSLQQGNWKKAFEILDNDIQVCKTHSELMAKEKIFEEKLLPEVKQQAVRIYLWNFVNSYQTISLQALADMFELPVVSVRQLLHRMIIDRKLAPQIALDSTSTYLV